MHSSNKSLTSSIAVIGAGDVGASIAYSLLLNPVAHDVILVDLKEELLEAQVRDLGDATYRGNAGVRVKKGTFEEAGQADVIVITAGAKQKKGELLQDIVQCATRIAASSGHPMEYPLTSRRRQTFSSFAKSVHPPIHLLIHETPESGRRHPRRLQPRRYPHPFRSAIIRSTPDSGHRIGNLLGLS